MSLSDLTTAGSSALTKNLSTTAANSRQSKYNTNSETVDLAYVTSEAFTDYTTALRHKTGPHPLLPSSLTTAVRTIDTDVANPLTTLSAYLTTIATTSPPNELSIIEIHTAKLYLLTNTRAVQE